MSTYDRVTSGGSLAAGCDGRASDGRRLTRACACAFARDNWPRETVKIEFARQTPAGRPANRFGQRAAACRVGQSERWELTSALNLEKPRAKG